MTGVHGVLASGSRVCKGSDAIMFSDGGYLMPQSSVISQKVRNYLDKLVEQHGEEELTPLRVERGVYVFDFNVDEKVSKQKCTAARYLISV
eukprot:10466747-Karenia_brevis.AAC.1